MASVARRLDSVGSPSDENWSIASSPLESALAREAGPEDHLLGIGEMARRFNVSHRALRFYEARGLLHPRREGQLRFYDARDRHRLALILKAKLLGFTLTEIREMLGAPETPGDLHLDERRLSQQLAMLEAEQRRLDRAVAEVRRRLYLLRDDTSATSPT